MPGRKPWIRRGACAAIAAAAIAFTPGVAGAVVFPVTSTADSGPGTLRQAITDANTTTDPDYIHFDLPPSAPTIVLGATPLPPITQPLFIDGRSQPVTHRVELNGENVADSGLFVRATFSAVVGLDIHSFFGAGIEISNGAGAVTIADNYIGTNFDGTVAKPNHTGVLVAASAGANNVIGGPIARDRNVISGNSENGVVIDATRQIVVGNYIGVESGGSRDLGNTSDGILVRSTASHVQIGGDTPEERNVISGNGYLGIETLGPTNVVQGNYIGTDSTGAVAVPNEVAGVALESADNVVGGADPGVGNLISGNANYGIALNSAGSTRNHVTGNLIGTKADGRRALGNASGIYFTAGAGANGNVIGEPPAGANVIAYNTDTGIVAIGGTGNAFRANSIYGNGRLGIDLGAAGVEPNDVGDGDSGANDLQNFPVIDSVENAAGGTRIRGHLDTSSSRMYFVDLYSNDACDASGNGEGQHWLGQAFVTPDFAGHATFDVTLPTSTVHFSAPAYHVGEGGGMAIVTVERQNFGRFITSTATSTTGNTSEFGPCVEGPGTSSVQYATSADGATPGADYTESSGPLDFGATETSKT